jgi:ribosomal protein L11 methyltransferase
MEGEHGLYFILRSGPNSRIIKVRKGKKQITWLTIESLLPVEWAEPLSNFLMEQGASGIEEVDEGREWKRLKSYFPPGTKKGELLAVIHRYVRSLKKIFPSKMNYQIEDHPLPEQDWGENWKRYFKPVQVTPRILVKPPWRSVRFRKEQKVIEIIPGLAFGTGTHATTRLCIQALERRLRTKGLSVLDVGTGSGILSIVAAKLGAEKVWAVDPDELSIDITRTNVELNGVQEQVKVRRGTLGDVSGRFDLVVANIDVKALKRMRMPLARHLKKRGFLILSGILEREELSIRDRYSEVKGLSWVGSTRQDEWACLTFQKRQGG